MNDPRERESRNVKADPETVKGAPVMESPAPAEDPKITEGTRVPQEMRIPPLEKFPTMWYTLKASIINEANDAAKKYLADGPRTTGTKAEWARAKIGNIKAFLELMKEIERQALEPEKAPETPVSPEAGK